MDSAKEYKVKFDQYVEVSDDAIITNTMKALAHICLSMGPSGNWQGSIACVDLNRDKKH